MWPSIYLPVPEWVNSQEYNPALISCQYEARVLHRRLLTKNRECYVSGKIEVYWACDILLTGLTMTIWYVRYRNE